MLNKYSLSALLLSAVSLSAQADNYIGGDLGFTTVDTGTSFSPLAAQFKIGTYINDNFAVEGRLGAGISEDEKSGTDVKIKHLVGAYARGILPVNDKAEVYGLIGVTNVDIDATAGGSTSGTSDSGLSLGIGINVKLDRDFALNFEYANLYDDEVDGADLKVSSFSLGATMLF